MGWVDRKIVHWTVSLASHTALQTPRTSHHSKKSCPPNKTEKELTGGERKKQGAHLLAHLPQLYQRERKVRHPWTTGDLSIMPEFRLLHRTHSRL